MTDRYLTAPIYEAKVSRDVRIVYQIDLDTDLETKVGFKLLYKISLKSHALSRSINKVRSTLFLESYICFNSGLQ